MHSTYSTLLKLFLSFIIIISLRLIALYLQSDIDINELIFNYNYIDLISILPFLKDILNMLNPYNIAKCIFNILSKDKITLDTFNVNNEEFTKNILFMEDSSRERKKHWGNILDDTPAPDVIASSSTNPDHNIPGNNPNDYIQEFPKDRKTWITEKENFTKKAEDFNIKSLFIARGDYRQSFAIFPSENNRVKIYTDPNTNWMLNRPKPKVGDDNFQENLAGWRLLIDNTTCCKYQLNGDKYRYITLSKVLEDTRYFRANNPHLANGTLNNLPIETKGFIKNLEVVSNRRFSPNMGLDEMETYLNRNILKEKNRIYQTEKLLKARNSRIYQHLVENDLSLHPENRTKIVSAGGEYKYGKQLFNLECSTTRTTMFPTKFTGKKVGYVNEDMYQQLKQKYNWK